MGPSGIGGRLCTYVCVLECVCVCFPMKVGSCCIYWYSLCVHVLGGKNLLYVRKSNPPCEYETCYRTSSVNLPNTWVHDRVVFLALCVVLISVVIFAAVYQASKFVPHIACQHSHYKDFSQEYGYAHLTFPSLCVHISLSHIPYHWGMLCCQWPQRAAHQYIASFTPILLIRSVKRTQTQKHIPKT